MNGASTFPKGVAALGRLVVGFGLVGSVAVGVPLADAATGAGGCDFNGDTFDDSAVGVPGDDVNGDPGAGSVHVIYGTGSGLSAVGDQVWHRDRPGIRGIAGDGDGFGAAVDCGDFNGDGFDDLAIGVPWDDIGDAGAAGSVHVIYGSESGLSAAGDRVWHRDRRGIRGNAAYSDHFGWSLAAGDFNGDGFDDLL